MARFRYKAKKGPDDLIEGDVEADSEIVVAKQLMQEGFYPVWVRPVTQPGRIFIDRDNSSGDRYFYNRKIGVRQLANFTRQLSELIEAGLPLYKALGIISNQLSSGHLKDAVESIRNNVKDGHTFSESLKSYQDIFSSLYINLIRAGETAGSLKETLSNLADFLDSQEDIRSRVLSALSYPALILVVGTITIFILMVFVIPRLTDMFVEMGQTLPLLTGILIGFSNFLKDYWVILVFLIFCIWAFTKRARSFSTTKMIIDKIKLKIPVIGRLLKDLDLERFTGTLSMLLRNGVPILSSLKISAETIDNEVIKKEIEKVIEDVKGGASISSAFKRSIVFPGFLIDMSEIGEQGGFLDKTFSKVAHSYELERERLIKIVSSLIEPISILVMGILMGFVVVAMLLPVFQISLVAK